MEIKKYNCIQQIMNDIFDLFEKTGDVNIFIVKKIIEKNFKQFGLRN